jgi:hypothetical protein
MRENHANPRSLPTLSRTKAHKTRWHRQCLRNLTTRNRFSANSKIMRTSHLFRTARGGARDFLRYGFLWILAVHVPMGAMGQMIYSTPYTFTTLAGYALGNITDGTGSNARFAGPFGVATDGAGDIYVTDIFDFTIRKVTPTGEVTTLAGLSRSVGSADGSGSGARFSSPEGVAADNVGNVYVADTGNGTIRKVTPAGVVTTLAGLAGMSGTNDGIGSAARFSSPADVAVDSLAARTERIAAPAFPDLQVWRWTARITSMSQTPETTQFAK